MFPGRWQTHRWHQCVLVPDSVRQAVGGPVEACGIGLETRGKWQIRISVWFKILLGKFCKTRGYCRTVTYLSSSEGLQGCLKVSFLAIFPIFPSYIVVQISARTHSMVWHLTSLSPSRFKIPLLVLHVILMASVSLSRLSWVPFKEQFAVYRTRFCLSVLDSETKKINYSLKMHTLGFRKHKQNDYLCKSFVKTILSYFVASDSVWQFCV